MKAAILFIAQPIVLCSRYSRSASHIEAKGMEKRDDKGLTALHLAIISSSGEWAVKPVRGLLTPDAGAERAGGGGGGRRLPTGGGREREKG
jgi:hypothetical protein